MIPRFSTILVAWASPIGHNESGKIRYLGGLVKRERNELVCWMLSIERFRDLCKRGGLRCKEEGEDIVLHTLILGNIGIICSGTEGLLYEWRNPFVSIRVAAHGG